MSAYRRCSAGRENEVVHLFTEGSATTLCDREIGETWKVRSDDDIATCTKCVAKVPRTTNNVVALYPSPTLKEAQ